MSLYIYNPIGIGNISDVFGVLRFHSSRIINRGLDASFFIIFLISISSRYSESNSFSWNLDSLRIK